MPRFVLFNATERKHFGMFHELGEAQLRAASSDIGTHDEWAIIQLPEQAGAGAEVESGRGPRP
jgi:hypothetical protein